MREWRTCRFCGVMDEGLVMYGARHHAHPKCIVAALGWPETLRRFGAWYGEVFRTARSIASEALACGTHIEWPQGVKFQFGTTTERREASVRLQASPPSPYAMTGLGWGDPAVRRRMERKS